MLENNLEHLELYVSTYKNSFVFNRLCRVVVIVTIIRFVNALIQQVMGPGHM